MTTIKSEHSPFLFLKTIMVKLKIIANGLVLRWKIRTRKRIKPSFTSVSIDHFVNFKCAECMNEDHKNRICQTLGKPSKVAYQKLIQITKKGKLCPQFEPDWANCQYLNPIPGAETDGCKSQSWRTHCSYRFWGPEFWCNECEGK